MSPLSDIIALLDRWPLWKRIKEAPERIDALEARIAALEAKIEAPPKTIVKGRECPKCASEMTLQSEKPDIRLGAAGVKCHALACPACGLKTERQFSPGKGYL